MKTIFQIQDYLKHVCVASEAHLEMISIFCAKRVPHFTDKQLQDIQISPNDGVTSSDFADWFEVGLGSGDWGLFNGTYCLVIKAEKQQLYVRHFYNDKNWSDFEDFYIENLKISYTPLQDILSKKLRILGVDFQDGRFVTFALPHHEDKIVLSNQTETLVGIVESADQSSIRLYCSYSYDKDCCTYADNIELQPYSWSIRRATVGEFRRLNRELNTCGKIWNDRLKRVESATPKAKPGERYWYIDDKMNMICKVEENKPTSHFRYLAGNYFLSPTDCLKVLGQFNEILKQKMRE